MITALSISMLCSGSLSFFIAILFFMLHAAGRRLLRVFYGLSALFALLAVPSHPAFLLAQPHQSSRHYTGLVYGWAFKHGLDGDRHPRRPDGHGGDRPAAAHLAEKLFVKADEALCRSKQAGWNQVAILELSAAEAAAPLAGSNRRKPERAGPCPSRPAPHAGLPHFSSLSMRATNVLPFSFAGFSCSDFR